MESWALSHQGGRSYMEDFHFLLENFLGEENCIFGGIFDGHGGGEVARLAVQRIPEIVEALLEIGMREESAFRMAFNDVSNAGSFEKVGSTALCFLIREKEVIVANAGDSEIIFVPKIASQSRTRILNHRHNEGNRSERERILRHGREVVRIGHSWSSASTRSLGDHNQRKEGMISDPELDYCQISDDSEFIIAGSDGLWEQILASEAGAIAQKSRSARSACEEIFKKVFFGKKEDDIEHFDNITLIVIKI
jgi:serine/threonine protein phosphatase PrpC